jgi:glycosyltransferase involved in cell wall biosynthesis
MVAKALFKSILSLLKQVLGPRLTARLYAFKHRLLPPPPADPAFRTYTVRVREPLEPRRQRILHVIGNFWTGGSAQLVVDLVERLGHRYQQAILTRDLPPVPAYAGLDLMKLEEMEDTSVYSNYLREFRPELVHLHYLGHERDEWGAADRQWYLTVLKALEQYGAPVVENINIPTYPLQSPVVKHYAYVSGYVQQQFGHPSLPGSVVYPGADFAHFTPSGHPHGAEECVGMVYRLERDKLNEQTIEVFIELLKIRPQTKVLIVGGGSLMKPYQQAVAAAGFSSSVTFTGYVAYADLPAYYQRMRVFVAPVHRESFGQVTPFAMHMGLPVAGFRIGALPEIIGEESLLAPPGEAVQLARLLVALLDDPSRCRRLGEQNRQRAAARFSVESMISSYQTIYSELVKTPASLL